MDVQMINFTTQTIVNLKNNNGKLTTEVSEHFLIFTKIKIQLNELNP